MHFTYNENTDKSSLKQGDILEKTDELNTLLGKYHSHYTKVEYTHFQVLTQTCDLVKRGTSDKCSARYITLAAIRNIDTVIQRAISDNVKSILEIDGVLYSSQKHRERLAQYLSTIFNNNSKEYFFLKASPPETLLEDSCTFLHLSIAIKADEHYDLCLRAKRLELEGNFRAKLGWMVGNLYSRVGTEDYVPGALPDKSSFDEFIHQTLERNIAWVRAELFNAFKSAFSAGKSFDAVCDDAERKIEERRESRINTVAGKLKVAGKLSDEQVADIVKFLGTEQGLKIIEK